MPRIKINEGGNNTRHSLLMNMIKTYNNWITEEKSGKSYTSADDIDYYVEKIGNYYSVFSKSAYGDPHEAWDDHFATQEEADKVAKTLAHGDRFIDEKIKVHRFQDIESLITNEGVIGDVIGSIANKIKAFSAKVKTLQLDMKRHQTQSAEAAKKSATFKEKSAKTKDPLLAKINAGRASEEAMKQKIKDGEAKLDMMKTQLAASQTKTAELKKKKAEAAGK